MKILIFLMVSFPLFSCSTALAEDNAVISAKYTYSNWKPLGIDGVDYATQGLNAVELKLDLEPLAKKIAKQFSYPMEIFIPTVKYLFTPENRVEQKELLKNTASSEGAEALEYLRIDLPIFFGIRNSAAMKFNYEKAAFISKLTMKEEKSYIPFGGDLSVLSEGDTLTQRTDFEKFSASFELQMDPNNTWGLGYFNLKYRKPYSATIDGQSVSKIIRDSKFSSEGMFFLFSYHSPVDATEYFALNVRFGGGSGDIRFSESDGINSFLGPDETTAILFINAEVETRIFITENFRFGASLQYEGYNFRKHKKIENDDQPETRPVSTDLDVNRDELFSAQVGFFFNF